MKRKSANLTSDKIANEIRVELRSILRVRQDLYLPIDCFEPIKGSNGEMRYYVLFDMKPRVSFRGLKLRSPKMWIMPDERIHDLILKFAKAVWHLKDRLYQYAKATKQQVDIKQFTAKSRDLLICADLANKKKHGRNENISQLDPHLGLVSFDIRQSGDVEMYYDGAIKEKKLIVEKPAPISYSVDILSKDETIIGDAKHIISSGFSYWLPLIGQLGILSAEDPETKALSNVLYSG